MTVTGIQAGSLHNVVPAECRFMVDIRVNEYYSNTEIYETIRSQIKSEIKPRSFSLNSSSISENHPIVERCKSLGLATYGLSLIHILLQLLTTLLTKQRKLVVQVLPEEQTNI